MAYRTILVGTDGSNTARRATEAAARLASRLRAGLTIATAYGGGLEPETATAVLRDAAEGARELGVEPETSMEEGAPDEVLTAVAERTDADLVVVGEVGMGKPSRFRLGGIAERVAHAAPCDVLVVRTRRERADTGTYCELLAATDGSATATEAARKAFELAEMLAASVTLVHVGDELLGEIVLERTGKDRPGAAPFSARALGEGDPAERIVEVAGEGRSDLVVIGNKGMAGARRYLLGSVPSVIAHRAPVDVLIVKTTGRTVDDLAPGHGGLVEANGRRLAVYKGEDGSVVALSPRCQHMGCTVDWNGAERTWDCPCHGSRYAADGTVIRGPAKRDLEREELA